MIEVTLTPQFARKLKSLNATTQEEAYEKIELFKDTANHKTLHVHKLRGRLAGKYSFSVNFRYRIVFMYNSAHDEAYLLAIGDHSVYE